MMDAVAQIDAVLASALASHRPIGDEEPLCKTLGPFAATADALSGWAQHAGAGRVCVFARASWAPPEVGAQSRALAARGLVTLRQCRSTIDPTLFDYMARRTDEPFRRVQPVLSAVPMSAEARLLLVALTRLATLGRACPSLDTLAATIGVRSSHTVSSILSRLERDGLIAIEVDRAGDWRGVEILATGARTAELAA